MLWGVGSGVREALLSGSDPLWYSSAAKHMLTLEALRLATTVDGLPRVEQALLDLANKGHEARAALRSNYFDAAAGQLIITPSSSTANANLPTPAR
jgi:hypothetical protein